MKRFAEEQTYVPFPLALRRARAAQVQNPAHPSDPFASALLKELRDRLNMPPEHAPLLTYYTAEETDLAHHHGIRAWVELAAGEGERPYVVALDVLTLGQEAACRGADACAVRVPPNHPAFGREIWCAANGIIRALAEKIRARG